MSSQKTGCLCLLIAILCAQDLFAQRHVQIYNASLTDTALNILYAGIENEIVVTGWNVADRWELVHSLGEGLTAREDT